MKKHYLIAALSGFLLVSCAQDDLVVKPDTTSNAPVSFSMNLGNMMSRANIPLNEAGFSNFGVWAVKANDLTSFLGLDLQLGAVAMSPNVVMNDYWVKYCTTPHYGSFWSYVPSEWTDPTLPTGRTSQFLKYWDGSVTHTYFVAYAPATASVVFSNGYTQATDNTQATENAQATDNTQANTVKPTLAFPACTTTSEAEKCYLFSEVTETNNADYISGNYGPTDDPKKVELKFHRILSQLRIAFWESIPGYKVELESLSFSDEITDAVGYTPHGVVAIPAVYDAHAADAANAWTKGSYISSGTPTVTYSDDSDVEGTDLKKYSFNFSGCATSQNNLEFALPNPSSPISTSQGAPTYSPTTFNVLPNEPDDTSQPSYLEMAENQTWAENCGLQFVVNFKLKAEDTNEEIHVKGARVFVPAKFTAWKENTLYTYVFQITKNASGTTTDTNPLPYPVAPTDALYPIIFDGVTVQDFESTTPNGFVINQKLSASSLFFDLSGNTPVPASENLTLTAPDDVTYTWSSDNTAVATVASANGNGTGSNTSLQNTIIPGNTPGTATIRVKDPNGLLISTCSVLVYKIGTMAPQTIMTGSTVTLTNPFAPDSLEVTWTSSDAQVATVDTNGKVTGNIAGTATITCSCTINSELKTQSCTVTVTAS